ncbi:MAG: hypothetical protein Q8M29_04050 [Bacteroidota bacterium]|nr:hypothetical protein [Bacteroidota bacterium]
MNRFGKKIQLFVFGLSIGLLVGCLFFIFKFDDFFSKATLFEKENKASVTEELVLNENKDKTDRKNQVSSKKSTATDNTEPTNEVGASSKTTYTYTESADENINVLKEELIGVKNINVKDIEAGSDYKSISDSVLTVMSGISQNKKNDFFMVEFWKTPLNSKGYKMTRNRVLIYGLKENADLSMVKLEDEYYLKNNSEVYKLNYSTDFKPMEKVYEASVLQKLKL